MVRTLLRNGVVYDGSGDPGYGGSLLVEGDSITEVLREVPAHVDAKVVELDGLAVTPGFVDMHSHSDLHLIGPDSNEAKLLQGVTTEVIGQDGLSYAPVSGDTLAHLKLQLAGWNGVPEDLSWDWRSVEEFLQQLDGASVNVVYLVPHSTLRLMVMGTVERAATAHEVRLMCALLDEGLEQGAHGLSAGLTYAPGCFAETSELVALNKVVARHGGYFCPHHRNYGSAVLAGYRECLDIARESGVDLHLAHTHLSFEVNKGKLTQLLSMFDEAVADGVDLTFDAYPYLAGMTTLQSQLPGWARKGAVPEQIALLSDSAARTAIIRALDQEGSDGHQGLPVRWDTVVLADVGAARAWEWVVGKSLQEVSDVLNRPPGEVCLDILQDTQLAATCVMHFGLEEHVRALMAHPLHTVGSDGILTGTRPHPRGWGTFPRILGRYVREHQVLSLAEAVRHMSARATARLKLRDRGRLARGMKADIAIFDPHAITDTATYQEPRSNAVGVRHLLVNGQFAVRDGHVTGVRSGRALRPGARDSVGNAQTFINDDPDRE